MGRSSDTTVSVVITTRGRRDRLVEVLEPLLDDPATLEVVVVIDGSPDDSSELLDAIRTQDRRGAGGAATLRPLGSP